MEHISNNANVANHAGLAHYLKPRVRYATQFYLVAIVLTAMTIFLGVKTYQKNETATQSTLKIDQLRVSLQPKVVPKMSRAQEDDQKRWDALKVEREFAWKPLFLALERAGNNNIELLEFHPDKASKRVILRGEAMDHQALMTFLEKLESQPTLKNVHLTHQENVARERLVTITFEIKATLGP